MQCWVWEGKVTPDVFEDVTSQATLEPELEVQCHKQVSSRWSFTGRAVPSFLSLLSMPEFRPKSLLTRTPDCEGLLTDPSAPSSVVSNPSSPLLPERSFQNANQPISQLHVQAQQLACTLKTLARSISEASLSCPPASAHALPHTRSGKAPTCAPVTLKHSGVPLPRSLCLAPWILLLHSSGFDCGLCCFLAL